MAGQDAHIDVELTDAGDQVLARLTARGRGKQSGVETEWEFWQLWTYRDGRAVHGRGFTDREEAFEAAGLFAAEGEYLPQAMKAFIKQRAASLAPASIDPGNRGLAFRGRVRIMAAGGGAEPQGPTVETDPMGTLLNSLRKLKSLKGQARFIELADSINSSMPSYVVERVAAALNEHSKSVKGSKLLIYGVAYKKNVNDVRESPAFEVMEELEHKGAHVAFTDPLVASVELPSGERHGVEPDFGAYDAVVDRLNRPLHIPRRSGRARRARAHQAGQHQDRRQL